MRLTDVISIVYILTILYIGLIINRFRTKNYLRRVFNNADICLFGKEIFTPGPLLTPNDKTPNGIISYSLYGDYKKYSGTLLNSIKVIPTLLDGWIGRVYVGYDLPSLHPDIFEDLKKYSQVVVMQGKYKGHEGALWRFLPAGENLPFVSLDADDLFTERTARMIQDWIKSGKRFASFTGINFLIPMLAGMWGARPIDGKPPIPDIKERIDTFCEHWYGFDENFLRTQIWPFAKYDCWRPVHFPARIFVVLLTALIFVGMIYTIYKAGKIELKCVYNPDLENHSSSRKIAYNVLYILIILITFFVLNTISQKLM